MGAHLLLLLGCLVGGIALARLEAQVQVQVQAGRKALVEGEVEATHAFEEGTRVTAALSRVDGKAARVRAQLYARGPMAPLTAGQRFQVPVTWAPLGAPSNPGEPDRSAHPLRRGMVYVGGFNARALVLLSAPSPWRKWMDDARAQLRRSVEAVSPSPEAAALYLTLAAGLRASLGPRLEEAFALSGLAHLLSVSGLHVACLAVVLLWMIRYLLVRCWPGARRYDARRLAAPLGVPLVWAYVVFTGSQPPAVRSAVMTSFVLLGLALWRRTDPLNALCLAAMVVVVLDPACVGELSMQLSFLAVLSLIWLSPVFRRLFPDRIAPQGSTTRYHLGRLQETVLATVSASLAVTVGALPLIAGTFHRVSVAGLYSNVVCLPLSAILTALAAGGAALHAIHAPLAWPLIWVGTRASELMLWLTHLFAGAPGAALPAPSFPMSLGGAYWTGLAFLALGRGRWRWVGVLSLVAGITAFVPLPRGLADEVSVTFLSVGQGDAIVVSSGGQHALIDGGGTPGGSDPGIKVVLPFLRHQGIEELTLAVLSHPHPDHALGLISALAQVPARRLWLAADSTEGALTEALIASARGGSYADAPLLVEEVDVQRAPFPLGEATVEVLGPPADRALLENVNDTSVVLLVRHRAVSFLLTGDIEEAGEQALAIGPITVMKAPHHGSRTSSTPELLAQGRPRFAVFCVGRNNRYGFPHPEVEQRYRDLGAECFRTDRHGAIRFTSNGRNVRVETFHPTRAPAPSPIALSPTAAQAALDDSRGSRPQ